jgi:hypothetical protein
LREASGKKKFVMMLASFSIPSDRDQLFLMGPNIQELSSYLLTEMDPNSGGKKAVLENGVE